MKKPSLACVALASFSLSGAASAQLPAGLLGSLAPNVSSASAGNAAGLLTYCIKNKVLGAQDASAVLGKLTGTNDVTQSKDYAQGSAGVVQTGNGTGFSLANLKGQRKTRMCDMMLQHGRSLAGF